ncbi:MAG TPA: hypothetical protein VNS58_27355 [Puia sp.]|nr:hypothetical protein [Puia sp.]
MICIRESGAGIGTIQQDHVVFVAARVHKVIIFYKAIYDILADTSRHPAVSVKAFHHRIVTLKESADLPDYKRLLNAILKKGNAVKTADQIYFLKYPRNRVHPANNIVAVRQALQKLQSQYQQLLALDLSLGRAGHWRYYQAYTAAFASISFLLPSIFDYDGWFVNLGPGEPWGPYQLTAALNIDTCPYCNRSFTYTVFGNGTTKIARPQLDHFLPKSKHPLLALSFFNLIPSCSTCNSSIKGAAQPDDGTFLNPYSPNLRHSLIRFSYLPRSYPATIGMSNDLTITLKYNGDPKDLVLRQKIERHIEAFCLAELYANHSDIVREIVRKKAVSCNRYIEMLQDTFPALKLSLEEAYRLAYGNYFNETEFHRRPLSKLTKDIAIETGTVLNP